MTAQALRRKEILASAIRADLLSYWLFKFFRPQKGQGGHWVVQAVSDCGNPVTAAHGAAPPGGD